MPPTLKVGLTYAKSGAMEASLSWSCRSARIDVISIVQHREPAGELLRRRFNAGLSRPVEGLAGCLKLNGPTHRLDVGDSIVSEEPQPRAWLLVSGVAGEVRQLSDRRRQVLSLRLPGDILQGDTQEQVLALSAVEIVDALPVIRMLGETSPEYQPLRQAWVAAARLDQRLMRDHLVRLGALSAYERMAHFLMETHDRLHQIGLATATSLHLPIKQEVIAELMGLSVVHVSRTLQILKREDLAQARSGYVILPDRARLAAVSGYVSRFATDPARTTQPPRAPTIVTPRLANVH